MLRLFNLEGVLQKLTRPVEAWIEAAFLVRPEEKGEAMFTRRMLTTILVASATLTADPGFAQPDQATVGIQTTTRYSLEGKIAAVDANARTVTITSTDGTQRMLSVSPLAANITSTKVGDNVMLGVEDTRTFVLSSPGVATPAPGAASVTGAMETSQGVAGARLSRSIANWVVVRVDAAANTITLVNPGGGEVRTYNVTTDAGRQQLPRVKQGDNLTEINSRLVVAEIKAKS